MIVELPFPLEPGRKADLHCLTHVLQSIDCDQRHAWRRAGGTEIFQIPDANGFPVRPDHAHFMRMMAEGTAVLHPVELGDERAAARRKNGMHRADAKKLDPISVLRERFLDFYHSNPCNLSDRELGRCYDAFLAANPDMEALARTAPRAKPAKGNGRHKGPNLPWRPCGKTLRDWIASRGASSGRQLRDGVSLSGRTPRKRKIKHPVEIIEHWLGRAHAGRRDVLKNHRLYEAEIGRINRGDPTGRSDDLGELVVYPKPSTPYVPRGYTTFWRLKLATRSEETKRAAQGRHAAEIDHGGGGRMEVATHVAAIVGIDDSPVPVLAKIEVAGMVWVGRPTLTIGRSRYGGCFLGRDLSWDNASSATVLRTILDIGTPKRVPEDMAKKHPQLVMMCCDPVRVSVDNLAAHHHDHVEDSLRETGTDVDFTGRDRPRDKSDTERGVGIVLDAIFKCGPGAVDPIPLRRHNKNDPPAKELPTLDELLVTLDRGIATINVSPSRANMNRSPLSMFVASANERKPGIIADRERLTKAIGMVAYDVEFRASGLEHFACLRYSDARTTRDLFDRLVHLVRPSKRTKVDSVRVKIKYDAGDIGRVHVWDPTTLDWVTLECDQPEYANRVPKFIHEQILADIAAEEAATVSPATLLEYRMRLFEQAASTGQDADASERRRAGRIMQTPIFRMVMGRYVEVTDEAEEQTIPDIDLGAFVEIETTSPRLIDADRPTPRSARTTQRGDAGEAGSTKARSAGSRRHERDPRDAPRIPAKATNDRPARPRSRANRGLRTKSE